jgi:hypothetical protein
LHFNSDNIILASQPTVNVIEATVDFIYSFPHAEQGSKTLYAGTVAPVGPSVNGSCENLPFITRKLMEFYAALTPERLRNHPKTPIFPKRL